MVLDKNKKKQNCRTVNCIVFHLIRLNVSLKGIDTLPAKSIDVNMLSTQPSFKAIPSQHPPMHKVFGIERF